MTQMIEEPKDFLPEIKNNWPVGLSFEVALDEMTVGEKIMTEEDIASQFDLTVERLQQIKKHPAFRAEVRGVMIQIKDDGAAIKRKAKLMVEACLDTQIPLWMKDTGTSVDTKTKLLALVHKISGAESAEKAAMDAKNQSQVAAAPSINITLTQAPAPMQPTIMLNAERVVN